MDVYCRNCGEPWDLDTLHDEAGARYGIPYYLPAAGFELERNRRPNPAYDSSAYAEVIATVRAEFRAQGCSAIASYGARCNPPAPAALELEALGDPGLPAAAAAGAMYELCGDDMDGAAAMLEDLGY